MNARSIFLTFAFVMLFFSGGKSQMDELLQPVKEILGNFLFPKEPGIVRVRKMDDDKNVKGERVLDFVGLVEKHGYSAEEHNLTTNDGYNLVIHRISGSPVSNNTGNKKVVFIQHGILLSSDCWVLFGPNKDLAFLLADKGYDVWVGNFRGNTYCRSHVKWSTSNREFWDFSVHELAVVDLPAMIDYVLNHTGQNSLHYVGHSMGTTTIFILLSMKPEYNSKVKLGICLTPISYLSDLSPIYKELGRFMPKIMKLLDHYKVYDFAPQSVTSVSLGKTLCNDNAITQPICSVISFLIAGEDPAQLNTTALPLINSHAPAGVGLRVAYNYYQNWIAEKFQSYDYGPVGNYKRYKQKTPIIYDLQKISAPIGLFYSANDAIVSISSVTKLSGRLPNLAALVEIPFKHFNHLDVLWAIEVKTLLNDYLIQLIQEFDAK